MRLHEVRYRTDLESEAPEALGDLQGTGGVTERLVHLPEQ